MPRKSLKVPVEPSVIKWAVKSSGWGIDEISRKLDVNISTFNSWMDGRSSPTLNQVEKLSDS